MSSIISSLSNCLGSCIEWFSSKPSQSIGTTMGGGSSPMATPCLMTRSKVLQFYDFQTDSSTAYLGNFFEAQVWYDGGWYPCAEAAFQAAKTIDTRARSQFQMLNSGFDPSVRGLGSKMSQDRIGHKAFILGRTITLRRDWESDKDRVMYKIVYNKFYSNPGLRNALLSTGQDELQENAPSDYWGMGLAGDGDNVLGQILMQVREDLKSGFPCNPANLALRKRKHSSSAISSSSPSSSSSSFSLAASSVPTCQLPGCNKESWKKTDGTYFDFCGQGHATQAGQLRRRY